MRLLGLALALAGLVAAIVHFGGQSSPFSLGVDRPLSRPVSAMAFFAVGLIGWRLGVGGLVAVLVGLIGGATCAAFLTGRGLELPEMAVAAPAALALAGVVGAWVKAPPSGLAVVVAAVVGVAHGHLLSDGFAAAQDLQFLGGVAAGGAALALGGCLLGEAVGRAAAGVGERVAAGLAGVGVYLALGAAGVF